MMPSYVGLKDHGCLNSTQENPLTHPIVCPHPLFVPPPVSLLLNLPVIALPDVSLQAKILAYVSLINQRSSVTAVWTFGVRSFLVLRAVLCIVGSVAVA